MAFSAWYWGGFPGCGKRRVLNSIKHTLAFCEGGLFLKEIFDEYATMVAGGIAAALILGMAVKFVLGDTGIYEILLAFARGICG